MLAFVLREAVAKGADAAARAATRRSCEPVGARLVGMAGRTSLTRCGWCGVALRPSARAALVRAAACHDCGHSTVLGDDGRAVAFPRTTPRVHQVGRRVRFSRRLVGGGLAGGGRTSTFARAAERAVAVGAAAFLLLMPVLAVADAFVRRRAPSFVWFLWAPTWWYLAQEVFARRVDLVFGPRGWSRRGRGGPVTAVREVFVDPRRAGGIGGRRVGYVDAEGIARTLLRAPQDDDSADALASVLRAAVGVRGPGATDGRTPAVASPPGRVTSPPPVKA